ncbi:hypothetical protein [Streptomyces sp. GbtcB6]|uniref:hypothetical protein n=1 Tax=Streptomyces sp. GbtcB6 TaxID=2824751 RepID=UPI001C2F68E6|nr:hypothetical protein [Streptomyces sp. GbtcB6]
MTNRQMMTVAVLAAVLVWSTVMTVLGQLAAVAALLPSLGLLVQQIGAALGGPGGTNPGQGPTPPAPALPASVLPASVLPAPTPPAPAAPSPAVPAGSEEPSR